MKKIITINALASKVKPAPSGIIDRVRLNPAHGGGLHKKDRWMLAGWERNQAYCYTGDFARLQGDVEVQVPKFRDRSGSRMRLNSKLLPSCLQRARSMEELIPWLHLRDVTGGTALLFAGALVVAGCAGFTTLLDTGQSPRIGPLVNPGNCPTPLLPG